MLYPTIKKMIVLIDSKSKPLHWTNISNDKTDNEANDLCLTIPITNKINIEHCDSNM